MNGASNNGYTLPARVFVYGTLKKGYGNYERYLKTSRYVGSAVTRGKFVMLDSGFPVILPNEDGHVVRGEVFEVSEHEVMENLDALEGEGRMYDRRRIEVDVTEGSGRSGVQTVHAYIGCGHWARRRHRIGSHWLNSMHEWEWGREYEDIGDD